MEDDWDDFPVDEKILSIFETVEAQHASMSTPSHSVSLNENNQKVYYVFCKNARNRLFLG